MEKGRAGSPPRTWILATEPHRGMWAGVHAQGLSALCLSSPGVPPPEFFALEVLFALLLYADSVSTHVGRTMLVFAVGSLKSI